MTKGTMIPSPKFAQTQLQACANLHRPVPDAEYPNSGVTRVNHVYVAAARRKVIGVFTHRLPVDGMCQAEYRLSLL